MALTPGQQKIGHPVRQIKRQNRMAADPCESMGKDKNNTPVVNGRRMYKK